MPEPMSADLPLTDRRVHTLLTAADLRNAGVDLGEMASLMPLEGPGSVEAVSRWLERRPALATLHNGRAYLAHRRPEATDANDEAERTQAYLDAARTLIDTELRPLHPLLRSVLVTGSTAYRTPRPGDDCDLFLITRRGALWIVLAFAYVRLRVDSLRHARGGPAVWCLNFVLDENAAAAEFSAPRGFLFAREALMAMPLLGEREYRALLTRSPWLGEEAPRLFARWKEGETRVPEDPDPPRLLRALNVAIFPVLAAYLHAVGLYRNWRLRREGRTAESFVTRTQLARLAIHSVKFDELGKVYRGSSAMGADP